MQVFRSGRLESEESLSAVEIMPCGTKFVGGSVDIAAREGDEDAAGKSLIWDLGRGRAGGGYAKAVEEIPPCILSSESVSLFADKWQALT